MVYLLWFNQVKHIANQRGLNNWESLGTWRDYFHAKLSPEDALSKALIDEF